MAITNESNLRYAKLIHVSVGNGLTAQSNKVYIMEELNDGRIKCDYGRVGKELTTVYKRSGEWDKIYRSKLNPRKGYKDITDMISESIVDKTTDDKKVNTSDIKCHKVRSLFSDLMSFANKSIQSNYKVSQDAVTQLQIDKAQDLLTSAKTMVDKGMNIDTFNKILIELYTTIPRKMSDVRDYLASSADNDGNIDWINNFLEKEQDTLDVMAGQVKIISQKNDAVTDAVNDAVSEITILEQMGLEVSVETDEKSIQLVEKLLGSNSSRLVTLYKVINKTTQKRFDEHLEKATNKRRRLYWHGSRNENILSLINQGLLLRPTGVKINGKMFGNGTYHADKSQKSIGYSSLRGSYWANGNSDKGYLILHDVHIGKQKHIHNHNSSCYKLNYEDLQEDGYDSVFAHGGADLRNNEFIVYNEAQTTIAYLLEMK